MTLGLMVKWSIELSKYNLEFRSRQSIKAQVLADFVAECSFYNLHSQIKKSSQQQEVIAAK